MRAANSLAAAVVVAASAAAAAGTAHAVNWDAIAECESSGNWHIPNGGGLQIKPQTWWSNGGVGLPELAPKSEQIRVGKNIMASQGPKAWPKCAFTPAAMAPGSIGDFLHPPDEQGPKRPGSIKDFFSPPGDQEKCWLLLRCH